MRQLLFFAIIAFPLMFVACNKKYFNGSTDNTINNDKIYNAGINRFENEEVVCYTIFDHGISCYKKDQK